MTDRPQPDSPAAAGEGEPVLDLDIALPLPGFTLDLRLVTSSRRVALFGASGSGKTLTLEVIAGLQRPRSGHVRVLGETFFDANTKRDLKPQERRIGYVPQDYHLFPHMSAAANVAYGLRSRQRGRPAELLELVGLADQASKRPRELSGGQRQRVAFARALAAGPRLLLLDEPFSALDDVVRSQLRRSLAELLDVVGTPSLLVTHDLLEATLLADSIVVIRDGRVEQVGSGETLMLRPANAYIADLVGMTNRLQATVVTTEGGTSWVRWGHDTLEVAAHLGQVGSPVTLGMRPERLRVIRVLDDAPLQTVDATVERVTRYGLERLLSVRTAAGLSLEARHPAEVGEAAGAWQPAPGDRVRVQLAPTDLWPLADDVESGPGSAPGVR